jgi:hypothetical protein
MSLKSCASAVAAILALSAADAFAEDCRAKSTSMDIVAALEASSGCDAAMKLFEACEYGASGDVDFGAVVEKKCEADFFSPLKVPEKMSHQREMRICDRK